jgi:hypothetical protein
MSVAGQVVNPASVLCRFLDEVLPERQMIAEQWDKQAAEAPWSGVAVDGDRRGLGLAAEMRSGWTWPLVTGTREPDLLPAVQQGLRSKTESWYRSEVTEPRARQASSPPAHHATPRTIQGRRHRPPG